MEQRKSKTLYVEQDLLDQLQEGVQKFNFSKRVNQLVRLGLQVERGLEDDKELETSYFFHEEGAKVPITERVTELLKLGLDAESNLIQNKLTSKMAIEHLVKTYNKGHADNPIRI